MMAEGKPRQDLKTNALIFKEDNVTLERDYWHWGDMQVRSFYVCTEMQQYYTHLPRRLPA